MYETTEKQGHPLRVSVSFPLAQKPSVKTPIEDKYAYKRIIDLHGEQIIRKITKAESGFIMLGENVYKYSVENN